MTVRFITAFVLSLILMVLPQCKRKFEEPSPSSAVPFAVQIPLGLDSDLNIPKDNPLTPEKILLGRMLYFDERLSADNTVSCATCHDPAKGWSDGDPVSTGIKGQKGTRNAPTVINSTYMLSQFWDGRAKDLEEQAKGPLINPVEMGNADHDQVVEKIRGIPGYLPLFQKAFGEAPNIDNIAKAIASFERTVLGGNSRFDRYSFGGDKSALSPAEIRGMDLFFGKANCTKCHVGSNFSDSGFHNLGVGMGKSSPDMGRHIVTKKTEETGAFKTPTLRDISKHAPYMHDGSQATLEAVIEFYDEGGEANPQLDVFMKPLNLSAQEKADLLAFMKALDSDPYPHVEKPELPK
jgi:cytochrome c peroxidase